MLLQFVKSKHWEDRFSFSKDAKLMATLNRDGAVWEAHCFRKKSINDKCQHFSDWRGGVEFIVNEFKAQIVGEDIFEEMKIQNWWRVKPKKTDDLDERFPQPVFDIIIDSEQDDVFLVLEGVKMRARIKFHYCMSWAVEITKYEGRNKTTTTTGKDHWWQCRDLIRDQFDADIRISEKTINRLNAMGVSDDQSIRR